MKKKSFTVFKRHLRLPTKYMWWRSAWGI